MWQRTADDDDDAMTIVVPVIVELNNMDCLYPHDIDHAHSHRSIRAI